MIRRAFNEDIEEIYRMICTLENTVLDHDAFELILRNELSSDEYRIFLYEEDRKIIGIAEMRMTLQLHHSAKVAEIMSLFVYEEYRNRNIGRQLFDMCRQSAADAGCVLLELNSSTWRTDAHRFYERAGMRKDHYNFTMDLQ